LDSYTLHHVDLSLADCIGVVTVTYELVLESSDHVLSVFKLPQDGVVEHFLYISATRSLAIFL